MKEMILVDGRKYFYKVGESREQITAKQADKIFRGWKEAGRQICRKYGMGGRITWIWPE